MRIMGIEEGEEVQVKKIIATNIQQNNSRKFPKSLRKKCPFKFRKLKDTKQT
jgi:hypothetical protein